MAAKSKVSSSASPFADNWESIQALALGGSASGALATSTNEEADATKGAIRTHDEPSDDERDENDACEADHAYDHAAAEGDEDHGEGEDGEADDELEQLCEAALLLGLMDDNDYDTLTDAIASGAVSEADAIAEWQARLEEAEGASPRAS